MILYHFCPEHARAGIAAKGLRLGVIPWNMNGGKIGFQPGWQWLTANSEFGQEWCLTMDQRLPFRRDEIRLTINVPRLYEQRLITWRELAARCLPDSAEYIASFPEHKDWWLFRGPIPQAWLLAVDRNPRPRMIKLEVEG